MNIFAWPIISEKGMCHIERENLGNSNNFRPHGFFFEGREGNSFVSQFIGFYLRNAIIGKVRGWRSFYNLEHAPGASAFFSLNYEFHHPQRVGRKDFDLETIRILCDHDDDVCRSRTNFAAEKQWPLYRSSLLKGGKSGLQWAPHPVKSGGFIQATV